MKKILFIFILYSAFLYPCEPQERYIVKNEGTFPVGDPNGLALSSDGTMVAQLLGSLPQKEIYLWDALTGMFMRELRAGDETFFLTALRFAPDSRTLYAGYSVVDGFGVVAFDAKTWQPAKRRIDIPINNYLRPIEWHSPEKALIFIDDNVFLWSLIDGKQEYKQVGQGGARSFGAFDPSGKQMVLGSLEGYDNELVLVDCDNFQILRKLNCRQALFSLLWSPDSQKIVAATENPDNSDIINILVWDLEQKTNDPFVAPTEISSFPAMSMIVSPGSDLVFLGNNVEQSASPIVFDIKNRIFLPLLSHIIYSSGQSGSGLPCYGWATSRSIDENGSFKLCCGVSIKDNEQRIAEKAYKKNLPILFDAMKNNREQRPNDSLNNATRVMTIIREPGQEADFSISDWVMIEKK